MIEALAKKNDIKNLVYPNLKMTWHKVYKLGLNDGRGLPVVDVQSNTRSPGCDIASMNICNNNGLQSLGPLQDTVPFII
jgi:hypothetical protein